MNQIKPLPEKIVQKIINTKNIWFFEEGQKNGGVGEKLAGELMQYSYKGSYRLIAVDNKFVEQAKISELMEKYRLSKNQMINIISEEIK